jgi:hypothetical protein
MTSSQEIESKKIALAKLEAAKVATDEALRASEAALTAATTELATDKSPKARRAFIDARDGRDIAKIEGVHAAGALDTAREELAAIEKRMLVADYELAMRSISPEAIQRRLGPIFEACAEIKCREIAVGRTVEKFLVGYLADVESAAQLAQRAGIHPPRPSVTTEKIRELVIERLRSEAPVPSGVPAIHEWIAVAPAQSRYAS